eukprot:Blabericola_migrator_1__4378@NODE_2350_length_2903_cov_58_748237_g352_i2_p1_GENE_NODE_2350_length_2903_cov_58_748237_g352_i2NODE_2350_length_2903_cov_58_748237_g352_i2_p1_ORF_typecomplete_len836_score156_02Xpo1/PF08389_12/5_1e11Xpo1/PF08389_12/1_3e03Xpo1/PF08389_12/2_9e02CRM1_C/PF08767_11/1_3e03CRM1_C/PF08767_11/0_033CRM1_C/PF08767_11/1_8e03CK2S/PF15011_6/2_5e02CK2S/PF15011_6/90CK2S/PF15011_6/32_NODE_2350_length_2903_cov_58_748237_g352_i23512858
MRMWCLTIMSRSMSGGETNGLRQILAAGLWRDYLDELFPVLWNRSNLCGTYQVCASPPGLSASKRPSHEEANDGEDLFILNKLVSVMVQLIIYDYPDRMPDFFKVWQSKLSQLHGALDSQQTVSPVYWDENPSAHSFLGYVFFFLQVLLTLDVEIIADEVSSRTAEERQVSMRIKDGLRLGDIGDIFNLFQLIFSGSLFGIQEIIIQCVNDRKPAADLPAWWVERCSLALKAMARIVNWADLVLVVNNESNSILMFWNVAMLQSFGLYCADAAFECAAALIYKRMDGGQKCLMLKRSNLVEMVMTALQTTTQPPELELRTAQTMTVMIQQMIEAIQDLHKNKDKGGPYRLQMTAQEMQEAVKELWNRLISVVPHAVLISRNTSQWTVAEHLTLAMHEFFRLLRSTARDMGIGVLIGLKDFLATCLESYLHRVRVPDTIAWELTFERPDEFFLEDEDDGSPESEYYVLRKKVLLVFKQVYLLCLMTRSDIADNFQQYIIANATSSSDWRAAESGLTILSAMMDTYKDNSIVQSGMIPNLLRTTEEVLAKMADLINTNINAPPPVRQRYFECLGKLSTFYRQFPLSPEIYAHFVPICMTAFLGPGGLKSADSKKCVHVAVRELLRFMKGVRETPRAQVNILLPYFNQLSQDEYLKIVPLPNITRLPSNGDDDASPRDGDANYHPSFHTLGVDDQTKLFEIITVPSFQLEEKRNILLTVLQQVNLDQWPSAEHFETLNDQQRVSFADYVSRLLRSIGNALKGINRMNNNFQKECDFIVQLVVVSATMLGKNQRIQQNIMFIIRRLMACCVDDILASHMPLLMPIVQSSNDPSSWLPKQ